MIFKVLFYILLISSTMFAENAETVDREDWTHENINTLESGQPSNLKYFAYYDLLPDELSLRIFKEKDLSHLEGKRLVVGYGIADKFDENCKLFKASDTGLANDTTVCLPWWRIEREYEREDYTEANSGTLSFLETMKKPKPPLTINYCKEYEDGKSYPGGKVTCTTYFDRNAGGDCWENPEQRKCFVDNCGSQVKNKCTFIDSAIGEVETLPSAVVSDSGMPEQQQTKIRLTSHRYQCPSGPLVEDVECVDQENVMIFPYECSPDDVNTSVDDGEYIYCDESRPVFDAGGSIEGFNGTCSDGTDVFCPANKFKNTTRVCTEPIYEEETTVEIKSTTLERTYVERTRDVLSGESDDLAADPMCLRANTVEQAREQELYVRITGSGSLDDDIYVLKHKEDGSHEKIYCNMQHAGSIGNKKNYNGEVLSCLANDGSYSFDENNVPISISDIVSVQQNSENEDSDGTPFALGRNHYNSSKVEIDGIEVAPRTQAADAPYYPLHDGRHLKTWDNALGTLSILFPFAGAYEIHFYNKHNETMAVRTIDIEDFKEIAINGNMQLKLGRNMELAPGIEEDIAHDDGTKTLKANREGMWVEWGGGVYGGRDSQTGVETSSPNDSYVKENSITNILVRDLITGAVTPIPLSYPLPYPNRIFLSKLKVYEFRKYRCYQPFPTFNILGETTEARYVCSTSTGWTNFINGVTDSVENEPLWEEPALCEQNCRDNYGCTEKTVGENTGFTCTQKGGTDIGGDIEGNLFSDKNSCDEVCYTQNSCEEYTQSNCTIVEEQVAEPVTDYTGKTVFRSKSISYKCENTSSKQVGCGNYEVTVSEGDVDYNFSAVGFETKDYSGSFEDAVTKAHMMEVGQQHIFSGWRGQCVKGMKWDFSYLSDPMTIISYAMSAYSSAKFMGEVSEAGSWTAAMSDRFDGFMESVNESVDSAMDSVKDSTIGQTVQGIGDTVNESVDSITNAIDEGVSSIGDKVGDMVDNVMGDVPNPDPLLPASENLANASNVSWGNFKELEELNSLQNMGYLDKLEVMSKDYFAELTGYNWDYKFWELSDAHSYIDITAGDLALFGLESAFILAAPSEENYITANKLLAGYAGINANDDDVHSFNSCMASIGASLPNLIGWSAGSVEHSSSQLLKPWEHPLRVTRDQVAAIASVTSENYVTSQYMMKEDSTILMSLIAITPQAYLKATETICMGTKTSQAAEHIRKDDGGAGSGAGVGLAIAKAALGMICPPCSFGVTIIMDLYTNVFAEINTCSDEMDAMQWDMLNFKTNKFLGQDQCQFSKKECDAESFWLGCVRDRYEYCCYDQITTKVFAKGLKEQLNKNWDTCNDITINDLKDISFRECNPGEIPHINKCISTEVFSEFQQTLFRQAAKNLNMGLVEGLVKQAKESMAIPND